jgi:hypothetical protein
MRRELGVVAAAAAIVGRSEETRVLGSVGWGGMGKGDGEIYRRGVAAGRRQNRGLVAWCAGGGGGSE